MKKRIITMLLLLILFSLSVLIIPSRTIESISPEILGQVGSTGVCFAILHKAFFV